MENSTRNLLLGAALALVFGFLGAALWSYSPLGEARTKAYLLDNPDLLPQMAEAYRAKQTGEKLAQLGGDVALAFPGAVIGNPNGSRVLVEFSDYNCTYCKHSQSDVAKLIADDSDLKIVVREWPIFEGSESAARMALAAAMQGRFAQFHQAMFRHAPVSPSSLAAAAQEAGLDMERAQRDANSQAVTDELGRNMAIAREIGFTGTPSWVTGQQALEGAIGFDALKQAIASDES